MQVPSDSLDIKRAFQRHRSSFQLAELPRRPKLVSLFYAAECGLKYLIMMSRSLATTADLRGSLVATLGLPRVDLHNIEQLCLAANLLPVDVGPAPASFQINGTDFPPYKMHEAARYGVKIPESYVSGVEGWLEKVVAEVEARLAAQGI